MAHKLSWSPTARHDLRDLLAYISEDDPEAARKFAQGIFETTENLSQFPELGRIVPEFNDPTIREVIRKPCRLVYRIKTRPPEIEIARVWHAARGILQP